MKKIIPILLMIISLSIDAKDFSDFPNLNYSTKENFVLKKSYGTNLVLIPFQFNSSETYLKDTILALPLSKITQVYYVKTDHEKNRQTELDLERLKVLEEITNPAFFKLANNYQFSIITQTSTPANKLFHGFIIMYEQVSASQQLSYLHSEINRFENKENKDPDKYGFYFDTIPEYGYVIPVFDFSSNYIHAQNRMFKIQARNPEIFKSSIMAIDATGSMMPYLLEVLIWQKLTFNKNNKQLYLFFNDGNLTPNYSKKIGSVGGIYSCWSSSGQKQVMKSCETAISKGNGGDTPENNIEAILEGIKQYPKAKNIILVADNFATPRDLVLLKNVKKPVRVVLCGFNGSVNPAYLDIARETGGSVHTIYEDITELMKYKEGDEVDILGTSFIIKNGKFELLTPSART